ncbi:MAG: methionine ABC transporter ATP-binding protein [Peptococcaceae bacterium]
MNQPIIQIKDLCKSYPSKKGAAVALEHINLDIYPGEIFGIIGMSGAGKSTLVRCINFLEKPTSGTVIFDGQDLSKLSSKELCKARQSMGMIFQQFNLLMQRTALQNICFPMEIAGIKKEEALKRARELLKLVDMENKEDSYPSQLSGGQKQRVAIARALATNPKVLLCDEATSALDPKTTRAILNLLKDISKRLGITVIIITHEMAVIEEVCQKVAIIDNHVIAETGTVAEVFSRPKQDATKRLVYPEDRKLPDFNAARCFRLIFDGTSAMEPVISNMIMDCKTPVNILAADTRVMEGQTFGQMIIQIPEQTSQINLERILVYLDNKNVQAEEVSGCLNLKS